MSSYTRRVAGRATLIITATLLLSACGVSSATGGQPTATTTQPTTIPQATCASVLPGAAAINLQQQGFIYPIVFPPGSVGVAPQQVASGPGLFTVNSFTVCSPDTTAAAVKSFFSSHLGALEHGWLGAQAFPADGGLMASCGETQCWYNPKGGPVYYLIFDQFADKGAGVVTFQARWAISPEFPACGPNYMASGSARSVYFLPGYTPPLPLPPLSSTVPDDAAGGLRGYDVCSPGTTQSVSAFLMKELPATGWTKIASSPACFYSSQCWRNGSAVISWNVGSDPLNWNIAWRQSLP
ncbi:MAG TPA: hypothetical protein VFW76_07500 [Ktedonobacterales bacterium]|nr:hypothetical protein [Ktedonobacterales bacterium]